MGSESSTALLNDLRRLLTISSTARTSTLQRAFRLLPDTVSSCCILQFSDSERRSFEMSVGMDLFSRRFQINVGLGVGMWKRATKCTGRVASYCLLIVIFSERFSSGYSGVPSIVRVCAKRFHPHYSGHPQYMISGLNSAPSRTIHDITMIKHCMGYVQPTRRMTVAQQLCTQQGDRIICGISSRMQTPAVVRG